MALQTGDIVLMSFEGKCFGQTIIYTQHYRINGAGNPTTTLTQDWLEVMSLINGGGEDDLITHYKDLYSNEYTLFGVRLQRIFPIRSAFFRTAIVDGGGTFVGQTGTASGSAALTFRTEKAGRDQISNKKLGPVPEEAQLEGLLTAAYQAEVKVFGDQQMRELVLPVASVDMIPVVYHAGTHATDDYASFEVQAEVRSMSRRVVGRGE